MDREWEKEWSQIAVKAIHRGWVMPLMACLFGKKMVGRDDNVVVTIHQLRGVYYVTKIVHDGKL